MSTKNHRRNTDFQILYFLVGKCHTPDGAYSLLCELKEERELAIANTVPTKLRAEAKLNRAKWKKWSPFKSHRLEAQAEFEEAKAFEQLNKDVLEAAKDELAFINECMERLEPHRKYNHLPLPKAHEAAQQEEWKGELLNRATNFLLTQGTIPADEFKAITLHPEFKTHLLPSIENTRRLLSSPEGYKKVVSSLGKGPLLLEDKTDDLQCDMPEVRDEIQELPIEEGTINRTESVQ